MSIYRFGLSGGQFQRTPGQHSRMFHTPFMKKEMKLNVKHFNKCMKCNMLLKSKLLKMQLRPNEVKQMQLEYKWR